MDLPLTGIRVLDLSRLLPGPYFTMLLGDLGAEVIKVETPRLGDYSRIAPPIFGGLAFFESVNRNKKSIAINYRNQRGRAVFHRLVQDADVLVEGFRPGRVERLKMDYETLKVLNPGLVYCSLSGYGQNGPYRDKVGHDLNYIALGGLLDINGAPDGPPIPPGVQIADLAGGMLAAIAVLGALVGRQRSGKGAYLDVALFDAVISWAGVMAGPQYSATGENPRRGRMPLSGHLPCFNVYQTADGEYLTLGALEPPFWAAFCEEVGRSDLVERQWDTAAIAEVAAIFRSQNRADWLTKFQDREVCLEPVNTYAEMLGHPQVQELGLLVDGREGHMEVGSPFRFARRGIQTPAPRLGEHTREILTAAGYSEGDLDSLEEKGVIKQG